MIDQAINAVLAGVLFTVAFGATIALVIWLSNQSHP